MDIEIVDAMSTAILAAKQTQTDPLVYQVRISF
jgi:hypothetical protein